MGLIPHYLGGSFREARIAFDKATDLDRQIMSGALRNRYTEDQKQEIHGAWLRMRQHLQGHNQYYGIESIREEWLRDPASRPRHLGHFEAFERAANRMAIATGSALIGEFSFAADARKALKLAQAEVNSQCMAGQNCTPIELSKGAGMGMGAIAALLVAVLLFRS